MIGFYWGWDSLTDLLCNLLGALILMILAGFALQVFLQPKTSVTGEIPSSLPVIFLLVTPEGIFPVHSAHALEQIATVPVIKEDGDLIGKNQLPSGKGYINVEFRAHPKELSSCLFLRPVGKGCTVSEIYNGACPGFAWSAQKPGTELLFFSVYPGGYRDFQNLCRDAALAGFETTWKPHLPDEPTFLCQGDPNWIERLVKSGRAIASQSCLWLLVD